MTTLDELPPQIQEMLCAHEALQRLGFSANDIYVGLGVDPTYSVTVPQVFVVLVLKRPGGKTQEFNLRVCDLWCDETIMLGTWTAATLLWNKPESREACRRLWLASHICSVFPEIAAAMKAKGLPLPAVDAILKLADRAEAQKLN